MFRPDESHLAQFERDGFVVVRGLLSSLEVSMLRAASEQLGALEEATSSRDDGEGLKCRKVLWNRAGDDFTGLLARSERVAGSMARFLGGEVYHYHTKLMQKDAYTGGQFHFHQDYGYWYNNGCLCPDMGTVMIAVDACTPENGCLEVLRGSHRCGRIDHRIVGQQFSADPERVTELLAHPAFQMVPVPLSPGDALFFHCNLIHKRLTGDGGRLAWRSAQNRSPHRRWCLLVAFNRADNDPLDIVPDAALAACSELVSGLCIKNFLGAPVTMDGGRFQEASQAQARAEGAAAVPGAGGIGCGTPAAAPCIPRASIWGARSADGDMARVGSRDQC